LYFIHNIPNLLPNSQKIADDLFWGGDFDILKELLLAKKLKDKDIRFFLGYSGWSKNQLEEELEVDSWVVTNNSYKNIFSTEYNSFWKNELMRIGGEYQMWANAPSDPSLN